MNYKNLSCLSKFFIKGEFLYPREKNTFFSFQNYFVLFFESQFRILESEQRMFLLLTTWIWTFGINNKGTVKLHYLHMCIWIGEFSVPNGYIIIWAFSKIRHISTALIDLSLINTLVPPPLSVDFLACHNITFTYKMWCSFHWVFSNKVILI